MAAVLSIAGRHFEFIEVVLMGTHFRPLSWLAPLLAGAILISTSAHPSIRMTIEHRHERRCAHVTSSFAHLSLLS